MAACSGGMPVFCIVLSLCEPAGVALSFARYAGSGRSAFGLPSDSWSMTASIRAVGTPVWRDQCSACCFQRITAAGHVRGDFTEDICFSVLCVCAVRLSSPATRPLRSAVI